MGVINIGAEKIAHHIQLQDALEKGIGVLGDIRDGHQTCGLIFLFTKLAFWHKSYNLDVQRNIRLPNRWHVNSRPGALKDADSERIFVCGGHGR